MSGRLEDDEFLLPNHLGLLEGPSTSSMVFQHLPANNEPVLYIGKDISTMERMELDSHVGLSEHMAPWVPRFIIIFPIRIAILGV